jgi:uncharacterized protein YcbX
VMGNVGRCALTTRRPDTGDVDFKTLHHIRAYRDHLQTSERLPFGVHASVVHAGAVRVGDAVTLAGRAANQATDSLPDGSDDSSADVVEVVHDPTVHR